MRQTINIKKLLKATVAISGIALVGCYSQSDNWENDYAYEQVQIVEEAPTNDYTYEQVQVVEQTKEVKTTTKTYVVDDAQADCASQSEEQPCLKSSKLAFDAKKAVATSKPAEPLVVPVKPADKKVTCKTEEIKQEKTVTIKHKPQVAPTSEVKVETPAQKEEAPVPPTPPEPKVEEVPAPVEEIVVEEVTVTETTTVEKPVVEEVKEEVAVVEDKTAEEEAALKAAEEEAARKAAEEAALKAAEEEAAAQEAAKKAAEEERARLQKEMDALKAEKQALEEEKIRISQIQQPVVESCEDIKDWVAPEGTTLRSLLLEWGNRVGWRVVWNMDRDYALEAGAVFRGRFVDVAAALLRSFARATPAPKGTFYKGNKVLVISTREDENAD